MTKIAVAGKGGSGKTTVAGVLARLFADGGHDVLAVDADSIPTWEYRSASAWTGPTRWWVPVRNC